MHISRLRLRNFRNFRKAEFRFNKGVNTLIGENGSGKTNAFYAIRLMLDDTLPRRANRLAEADFNRAVGAWRGHWIIISLDFEELDASEGCQVIRHTVGHMDATNRGTYTLLFRPVYEIRRRLFEMTRDNATAEDIRRELTNIDIEQYEPVFTGRATSDITDDAAYASIAGDFNNLRFPNPDLDDSAIIGVKTQPLHSEVSCTFIKALRDVVSDLRSYRDSPLLALLRGTERSVKLEDAERIIGTITNLNNDISSLGEIRRISQDIQDTLYDTVGHTYSPEIDIRSALPEDIDRLLQGLALKVSDPSDKGYQGDVYELSLGGANLIYLSLKLLEYERKLSTDRVAHFLLIEEPEAHIHTHIQKTLFEKYGYQQTQVIVSTHSTHISAASQIRNVNILGKFTQEARVFHPSAGLDPQVSIRIERYLDAVRSTLLFAKGIVLVEGDAEMILIPSLFRKVFGISLDELGVSVISMSAAVFSHIAALFDEQRINRHCAIVTDLDTSIVPLPANKDDDDQFQRDCRNSQESGGIRRQDLDATYAGSTWVKLFFATYTFEVDLLLADNATTVTASLTTIYTRLQERTLAKTKLTDADVGVCGREVLRLAKKEGKGWFALLLSEHLTYQSNIPQYILEAVAFACRTSVDIRSVHLMAKHRLEAFRHAGLDVTGLLGVSARGDSTALINAYTTAFPDDVLTTFIRLLGLGDG